MFLWSLTSENTFYSNPFGHSVSCLFEERHFHIYVDKKEKIEKKINWTWPLLSNGLQKRVYSSVYHGQNFFVHFIPSMVQQWYFVSKIVLTYCEKNCSTETFEICGWTLRIYKNFEITRLFYSNSVRSEQFLKQNAF